jgi:hypothetical protein
MVTVKFVLGEPPYEPGDVAELTEADAENKFYDGIVEYADAPTKAVEVAEEAES